MRRDHAEGDAYRRRADLGRESAAESPAGAVDDGVADDVMNQVQAVRNPAEVGNGRNSIGVGWATSWLPDSERRTVLKSRSRPLGLGAGTNAALRANGESYVLSGTWPLMTGAADSEWCLLSGRVVDGSGEDLPGPPQIGRAIVPVDQVRIEETSATPRTHSRRASSLPLNSFGSRP